MYIKYGSFQHAAGEANLLNFIIRPRRSPRGFQLANIVEAHVAGTLKLTTGEDQYDLTPKINNLQNALALDGYDFGLYHDNGTPTAHVLYSADQFNLTGNQVIHQTFPASHNGEYSSGRDFAYAIRAEFQASTSLIIDYQETITHYGTGGPRVEWFEHKYRQPFYRRESLASVQTITQYGYAVTLGTYLVPPPPILPLPWHLEHQAVISRTGPKRFAQGYEGYRISWRYTFKTPTAFPVFPGVR